MLLAVLLAAVVGGVCGGVLFGGSTGQAHFQTYEYTLKDCPAAYKRQVDPINIVFPGYADGPTTVNHIQFHTKWDAGGGSTQYFSSHGSCGAMYKQRAWACPLGTVPSFACDRFHIRVRKTYHSDGTKGETATGDAHHEDWVDDPFNPGCLVPSVIGSHAVDKNGSNGSGFDKGRREMRLAFNDGYAAGNHWWYSEYWNNRRNFKQCDGDWARSDGYTVHIRLHNSLH